MYKKVVSLIFLISIVLFGAVTLKDAGSDIVAAAKENGFNRDFVNKADASLEKHFMNRYGWINLNGAVQRAMGITFVPETDGTDVYKLDNGNLIYTLEKKDFTSKAEKVAELMDYAKKESGAELLYVQLPFKAKNEEYPSGAQCFALENSSGLVSSLQEAGVPVYDLYSYYLETEADYEDQFYHTDHHWKPSFALKSADLICSQVHDLWGFPYSPELLQPDNYDIETREDYFLGSLGKRVGQYYGGVDDFEIYTPKSDTSFSFWADSVEGIIEREGSFSEALIDWTKLEKKDYFQINCYVAYIGGDYKINKVVNHNADNDTKVLLVRDSFSCALQPFLCMNYAEVTAVDLRSKSSKPLFDLIAEEDFDLIIIAFNPSSLEIDSQFVYY